MLMHSRRGLSAFVGLAALLIASAPTFAQDRDLDTRALLEKIERLENRVDELETEREAAAEDALETRINAISDGLAAAPGENGLAGVWSNGARFVNADDSIDLKFGGRLHIDFSWGSIDDSLRAGPTTGRFNDAFRFRRARIYVAGKILKNVSFHAEYDFADDAGDGVSFANVWIQYAFAGIKARVGHFKQPFGMEEIESSNHITFNERALPVSAFTPAFETGVMLYSNFLEDDRLYVGLSVFRDTNLDGDAATEGNYNFAGRATFLPYWEEDGRYLIHVGGGFVYSNPAGDNLRLRSREVGASSRLVDTTNFGADDVIRLNAEIAAVWGSISMQGEYYYVDVEGTAPNNDPAFWGGYVQFSYFLTGEHRPYDRRYGIFTRVIPNENALDGSGGIGAWEASARLSFVDLNDDQVNGGEQYDITVAVTWYINPNTKIRADYVYGNVSNLAPNSATEGDLHAFTIRFQIDF